VCNAAEGVRGAKRVLRQAERQAEHELMDQTFVAAIVFICLVGAAFGALLISERFPQRYRHDDTHNVVRLTANIFVVTTSLLLGLLLNSAKNTFEGVDRNVHAFATDIILLDRSLQQFGPEAADARQRLAVYLRKAIDGTWPAQGAPVLDDRAAELRLEEVGSALAAIRPSDPVRADLWRQAEENYQNVVRLRWVLVEESEGSIPAAFLVMLGAWLVLIFGSFGYRAPRNAVVLGSLVAAAFLITMSIYLVLDMDIPFSGPIQVSPAPLERAAEHLRR
jgi:hypothetical protein